MDLSILSVVESFNLQQLHYRNGLREGTQVFVSETIFGDLDFLNTGSFFVFGKIVLRLSWLFFEGMEKIVCVCVSWSISYTNSCFKNRHEL